MSTESDKAFQDLIYHSPKFADFGREIARQFWDVRGKFDAGEMERLQALVDTLPKSLEGDLLTLGMGVCAGPLRRPGCVQVITDDGAVWVRFADGTGNGRFSLANISTRQPEPEPELPTPKQMNLSELVGQHGMTLEVVVEELLTDDHQIALILNCTVREVMDAITETERRKKEKPAESPETELESQP